MAFIVVSGQPGAGKTTLARSLAERLGMALLSKDTIKEALAALEDASAPTVEASQQLGAASFRVLFAIAAESTGAVLEASWDPAYDAAQLARLGQPLIEVHCRCPPDIARSRYLERIGDRHWVHLDSLRADDERLWAADTAGPLGLSSILFDVDTTRPVDTDRVVAQVRGHPSFQ